MAASLLAALPACKDRVRLHDAPGGEEWALFLDGETGAGSVDDRLEKGSEAAIELENFTAPGDVFALVRDRPPKLVEKAPWTPSSGDVVDVQFSKTISIPLTIWVLAGPFAEVRDRAVSHVLTAAAILRDERMGVELSPVDFKDATADGFTYFDFDCSLREDLQAKVGADEGRVNAYWLPMVGGNAYIGDACEYGGGFVAIGKGAGDDLLVHELGHSFGLHHTDLDPGFTATNVMWSESSVRKFLTEGQIFRAHLDPKSVLNWLYAARPGEPVRACAHGEESAVCPAIDTRAWAEDVLVGQP